MADIDKSLPNVRHEIKVPGAQAPTDVDITEEQPKQTVEVKGTRGISKLDMVMNNCTPEIEVDSETYEVHADGELLTCEPASELPMAQRYFLF